MRALRSLLFAIPAASCRRPSLSAQEGSLLVEVMVGAVVLAITSLAVLSGLDGAQETGRDNRDRTTYANLAQQDVERLRSMPISAIANLDETRTVRVGQVDYTVHSETEWTLDDPTNLISCTDYDPLAEYLSVTSSVSSPGNANNPVTETTLLTPAPGAFGDTGTATVRLTDRDGNPKSGLNVVLSGPGAYSETTNALGCAVFRYIEAGSYTAEVAGVVSWSSELPATAPVTVNAGRTTLNPIEVDAPASLRAHFKTPSTATPPSAATDWSRISVTHAKLPAGFKVFPDDTATAKFSSIDATELFPHRDAYGVYAGSCPANNPAFWSSGYFQAGGNGYVVLDPGANLVDVNVEMPVLTIDFTKRALAGSRYHVMLKQVDTDCTETMWDFTLDGSAWENDTNEVLAFPLPFGRYKVCVDDGFRRRESSSGSSNSHYPSPPTDDPSSSTPTPHRMMPPSGSSSRNGALVQTDRVSITSSSSGTAGVCSSALSGWG